jgi:hypothetical protein
VFDFVLLELGHLIGKGFHVNPFDNGQPLPWDRI